MLPINTRKFYRTTAAVALCFIGSLAASTNAAAQLGLPSVDDTLNDLPTRDLDDRLNRELERRARQAEEQARLAAERAEKLAIQSAGMATGVLRPLLFETDPNGARIEFNTITVIADSNTLDDISSSGFTVMSKRELSSLDMTLATLRNTGADSLAKAVKKLRRKYPDAVFDFNHVYEFASEPDTATPVPADVAETAGNADNHRFRVGIIDSAVQAEHRALANVVVISRDLAENEGKRPLTHGTAVASLVARSAQDSVTIMAASVFVQIDGYAPGASTESLVAALDWLVAENVDVINMSLAGPGNRVLQVAVQRLQASGPPIVAAVGNNGPSSEPLYPAAYDGTIGITAVDRDHKIFRYANRGKYVDFAALGVHVKVADSTNGGWRIESGTSMASPRVAVMVARLIRDKGTTRDSLETVLQATSEDLGRRGFDKVFGHGLIAQAVN